MYQSAPDSHTRMLTLKNFERESGLLATLQHPSIPKVYDFFEENGRIYLILELIPGKDYESVLEENDGPLDEKHIAQLGICLLYTSYIILQNLLSGSYTICLLYTSRCV